MGTGIDAARDLAPEHAGLIDNLKDQLLIVFLRRLGGEITVPVSEVDDTGDLLFAFSVDGDSFNFKLSKKQ